MRTPSPKSIRTGFAAACLLAVAFANSVSAQQTDSTRGLSVTEAESISLEEAVKLALQVQPTTVGAVGTVRNAEAQVRSAKGAYLPNLSASSSGSSSFSEGPSRVNSSGELINGNVYQKGLNLGLNASIDLFTGFRRGADSKVARATRDAADANLVDARYSVTLTTVLQFYAALAAQQLVRVREASVTRAEEQLKVSVAKLHAGSATRSDSLRSLVTLGTAKLELVSAQADVATQQAELGRLTGIGHRLTAADDSSFYQVIPQLDTTAIMREAQDQSPKVQNTAATAVAARALVKSARSGYWPMLALTGSTNWNGTNSRDYQLFASRALTLGVSWALFNRFQREETIVNRLTSLDEAEATASDTRRAVESSLTSQFALLDAGRLRIDITRTSVEAAQEDLRVVSERYRLGAATIVDVLTSQEALTQAQVDEVNARFDYLRAKIQIEALIGRQL